MPFTIEEKPWTTEIVIMDDSGDDLDLGVIIENAGEYEGYVSMRQFNQDIEGYDVVTMSPRMFKDLMKSFDSTEGFHGLLWK